jgi:hypothetical protein
MRNCPCKSTAVFVTACLIFSALSVYSTAQESKAWQFPAELKPALDARLNLFQSAQAEGRWDDVSDLLGDYRRGYFSGYLKFTQSHKTCLVSEMQKFPMVSFDYTIQDSPYSSEILCDSSRSEMVEIGRRRNLPSGREDRQAGNVAYSLSGSRELVFQSADL